MKKLITALVVANVLAVGAVLFLIGRKAERAEMAQTHTEHTHATHSRGHDHPHGHERGQSHPHAAASGAQPTDQERELARLAHYSRAIEPPTPSALEERNQKLSQLVDTGPGGEEWIEPMNALVERWQARLSETELSVELEPTHCYRGGCTLAELHNDGSTLDGFLPLASETDEYMGWRGAKYRSGPITRSDGRIEVTWVFSAP